MIGVILDVMQRLMFTPVTIDNLAFRMHYLLTTRILFMCALLGFHNQYGGEQIQCTSTGFPPDYVLNSMCLFYSTYTFPEHLVQPYVDDAAPFYSKPYYQTYHLWVPFILFGQALLFHVPRSIWSSYEESTMAKSVKKLEVHYLTIADGATALCEVIRWTKISNFISYMNEVIQFKLNKNWAYVLFFCEVLNLLNVLFQLKLMDMLLNGNFITYGLHIFDMLNNRNSWFDRVFPKMTQCTIPMIGPSGSLTEHDAICMMSMNVINEKMYMVLWFWYVCILLPVSVIALLWRIAQFALYTRESYNWFVLNETYPGPEPGYIYMTFIAQQTTYSDWLFIHYLSANIDGMMFRDVLHSYITELQKKRDLQSSDTTSLVSLYETSI